MESPATGTAVTVTPAQDAERFLATDLLVWFDGRAQRSEELLALGVPTDQRFAVDLPDLTTETHAGIYGVRPLTLCLPGGALVACPGLSWVGVHPDARRRGVLRAMLRDHFVRARELGATVSLLHASEPGIYGRFGYGLAALEHHVTLGRGTTFAAPGLEESAAAVRTEYASTTTPGVLDRLQACWMSAAPGAHGSVVGTRGFAEVATADGPEWAHEREPHRVIFAVANGTDVGAVVLRRTPVWENARPAGKALATRMVGTPAARLALLRRLVDLDLTGGCTVEGLATDDPLFDWVAGPRATGDVKTYDSTWVRVVDIETAWRSRQFEDDCEVVVEIADAHAPWNTGRWRLSAQGGEGTARRTDADAELTLDVSVLGAAHLGRSVVGAARSGLVSESRAGSWTELARALRTGIAPVPSAGF